MSTYVGLHPRDNNIVRYNQPVDKSHPYYLSNSYPMPAAKNPRQGTKDTTKILEHVPEALCSLLHTRDKETTHWSCEIIQSAARNSKLFLTPLSLQLDNDREQAGPSVSPITSSLPACPCPGAPNNDKISRRCAKGQPGMEPQRRTGPSRPLASPLPLHSYHEVGTSSHCTKANSSLDVAAQDHFLSRLTRMRPT